MVLSTVVWTISKPPLNRTLDGSAETPAVIVVADILMILVHIIVLWITPEGIQNESMYVKGATIHAEIETTMLAFDIVIQHALWYNPLGDTPFIPLTRVEHRPLLHLLSLNLLNPPTRLTRILPYPTSVLYFEWNRQRLYAWPRWIDPPTRPTRILPYPTSVSI